MTNVLTSSALVKQQSTNTHTDMINNIGLIGINKFTHTRTAEVLSGILTNPRVDLIETIGQSKLVIETAMAAYKAAKTADSIEGLGQEAFYRDGFNAIMKERIGEDKFSNVKRAISGWRAHALFRAVCADEIECSKRALENAARWF